MRFLTIPLILLLTACGTAENVKTTPAAPTQTAQEKDAMAMAQDLQHGGKLDEAADIYRDLAAHSTGPVAAHLALSGIYRTQGRAQDRVAILREAEKLQPKNALVLNQLTYALISAAQPRQAIDVAARWINAAPGDATAYNGKAVALDHAGDHAGAQALYRQALKLDPHSPSAQNNLALSLILSGQIDEAIAMLEALVAQPSATMTMRQNLALAYGLKGEKDKALAMNLRDLSPADAQDNLRFYAAYASRHGATSAAAPAVPVAAEEMAAPAPAAAPVPDKDVAPAITNSSAASPAQPDMPNFSISHR